MINIRCSGSLRWAPGGLGNMLLESDWLGLVPSHHGSPNVYWRPASGPARGCIRCGTQRWVDKGSGLRVPCLVGEDRWTTDTHSARHEEGQAQVTAGPEPGRTPGWGPSKSFLDISGIGSALKLNMPQQFSNLGAESHEPVYPKGEPKNPKTPFC